MEVLDILREIFEDTPEVNDKTPRDRIDLYGGFKFRYENGIDVRVSIEQLDKVQKLLKECQEVTDDVTANVPEDVAEDTTERHAMKRCSHCEGYGCPKCLGFGCNISGIINTLEHPNTKQLLTIDDYSNLAVSQQRVIKHFITKSVNAVVFQERFFSN